MRDETVSLFYPKEGEFMFNKSAKEKRWKSRDFFLIQLEDEFPQAHVSTKGVLLFSTILKNFSKSL